MNRMTWEQAVIWLRNQPDQCELVKACYFDDPLLAAAERFRAGVEWQAVRSLLPTPCGRAVDLGAGCGISSFALAREGWRVSAVEPDDSLVVGAKAIQKLSIEADLPIEVVRSFSESISFADEVFDLVHARQVLHHSNNLWDTLCEIGRVLKPGGYLIATREHVINNRADLETFLVNHPLHHLYGGENAYLLEEYLSAIGKGGLQLVRVLATMQSAINFFPLSEDQRDDYCANPLRGLIGYRITKFLTRKSNAFGRFLRNVLIGYNSRFDKTPGRVYSFVARKAASSHR